MPITLLERIDSGQFADVWRARDSLDRDVAVKIIRDASEGVSNALDHAKALARTRHKNVVTVYAIERITEPASGRDVECVVMELIDGPTLEKRLSEEKFTLDEVRAFGSQIIDGIEHIHSQGLAHGDLHVGNIMMGSPDVKIIDILYRNTLAALSTQRRQDRLRLDLVSLRLILQHMLLHSQIDPSEATAFNQGLTSGSDISAIRASFLHVTNADVSRDAGRLTLHAYNRLTDENFVEGDAYAEALASETPRRIFTPLIKMLIRERTYNVRQIKYIRALWAKLQDEEIRQIVKELDIHLESDTPKGTWWPNLRLVCALKSRIWSRLSRSVRLKLEKLIVNDILAGHFDIHGVETNAGSLGTYAADLWKWFENRGELINNLESMLRQSWYTQNYVAKHFTKVLPRIASSGEEMDRIIAALKVAVENDARILVNRLSELPEAWVARIREPPPQELDDDEEDLPF